VSWLCPRERIVWNSAVQRPVERMAHRAARERWYKARIKRTSWQTAPNAWDQTSGSSDREDSKPENVTHHKGEEIQRIGCVYQNINWETTLPPPLPLTVPAPKHRAAALALSAAVVQVGIAYLLTPEAAALGGLPQSPLRARQAHGDPQPAHRPAVAGHRQSPHPWR
jgi:hypothetical protein